MIHFVMGSVIFVYKTLWSTVVLYGTLLSQLTKTTPWTDTERVCLKNILGKEYVGYISALESCELKTLESRRDKLSLSSAKKCIKSLQHCHLFPAAVDPYEHQLRHQEQQYVNHARTKKKYRKSAIPHNQRLLNR